MVGVEKDLIRAWARYALKEDDSLDEIFNTANALELKSLLCFLAGYFHDATENLKYLAISGNKKA